MVFKINNKIKLLVKARCIQVSALKVPASLALTPTFGRRSPEYIGVSKGGVIGEPWFPIMIIDNALMLVRALPDSVWIVPENSVTLLYIVERPE